MIFVVEVTHGGQAHAWFAFDGEDLLNKVAAGDALQPWEIHDVASPRELLDMVGAQAGTAQAQASFPGLCRLADEYGIDTLLYRADHLLDRGCYQDQPVQIEAACEAALQARVSADPQQGPLMDLRIYWSEQQAVLATESDDPIFHAKGGWRAMHALREQLLSLDVLAEG